MQIQFRNPTHFVCPEVWPWAERRIQFHRDIVSYFRQLANGENGD
jgi:lipid A disaccharide synthetase